jgi:hypothetical protein
MSNASDSEAAAQPSQIRVKRCKRRSRVFNLGLEGEQWLAQPSMASSTSEHITNTLSTTDLPTAPSSQVYSSSDGSAFFLAPSLMQAIQDMPHASPKLTPNFDTTEKPSILDSNIAGHNNHMSGKSMQNEQVAVSSSNTTSTSEDPHQASAEALTRGRKHLQEGQDEAIESRRLDIEKRQGEEATFGKDLAKKFPRHYSPETELRIMTNVVDYMDELVEKKNRELGEALKYNTELRKRSRKEMAEAQEKLKKKDIYTKSLDEYIDELETKICLLKTSYSISGPSTEQAQVSTETESTAVPIPVQQNNQPVQNTVVGDATYRWQAYLIKCLQQAKEDLIEVYQDLKMKEDRAFKDAIHFERKLNNNMRAINEHMRICHESNAFLNRDMTRNLLEMQAICDGKAEDQPTFVYDNAAGKVSVSAAVEPESTQAQHGEASADACNSQSPTIDDVGDGEEGEEKEEKVDRKGGEVGEEEEGFENNEVIKEHSQSSECGSDWSNVSMSKCSEDE